MRLRGGRDRQVLDMKASDCHFQSRNVGKEPWGVSDWPDFNCIACVCHEENVCFQSHERCRWWKEGRAGLGAMFMSKLEAGGEGGGG